jgi:hypothetical protein
MNGHGSRVRSCEVWVWMGVRDIRHYSTWPGVVLLAEGVVLMSPPGSSVAEVCLSLLDPDFTFALALALPAERSGSCDARRVFIRAVKEVQARQWVVER